MCKLSRQSPSRLQRLFGLEKKKDVPSQDCPSRDCISLHNAYVSSDLTWSGLSGLSRSGLYWSSQRLPVLGPGVVRSFDSCIISGLSRSGLYWSSQHLRDLGPWLVRSFDRCHRSGLYWTLLCLCIFRLRLVRLFDK